MADFGQAESFVIHSWMFSQLEYLTPRCYYQQQPKKKRTHLKVRSSVPLDNSVCESPQPESFTYLKRQS